MLFFIRLLRYKHCNAEICRQAFRTLTFGLLSRFVLMTSLNASKYRTTRIALFTSGWETRQSGYILVNLVMVRVRARVDTAIICDALTNNHTDSRTSVRGRYKTSVGLDVRRLLPIRSAPHTHSVVYKNSIIYRFS